MKYKFSELVDVSKLQELTDELNKIIDFPSAIIGMDGDVLTASGWQRICTDFHRQHPQTRKDCHESDTILRKKMYEGDSFVIYKCPRGLVDASLPIIINGEHVANVFSGQIFLEPPDEITERFFREQAHKFGFDEKDYINAFKEIPVFTEKKFQSILFFIAKFAQFIADTGLARLHEIETTDAINVEKRNFFNILNTMEDGVYIVNQQYGIEYINPALKNEFGEVAGRKCFEYYYGRKEPCPWCKFPEIKKGESIRWEWDSVKSNKIYDLISTPFKNFDGSLSMLQIFRDMTEFKKASAAVEKANHLKSEFLANMSHEIRTPLNAVIGMTHLLIDTPLTDKQKHLLNCVQTASNGLFDLISGTLDLSKIEAGQLALDLQPFSPASLLSFVQSTMTLLAEEKGIDLSVQSDNANLPNSVTGDEHRLRQILINLVNNAIKFTEAGTVTVKIEPVEYASNTNAELKQATLRFSVIDTGIGIPADQQDAVFASFAQADGSTTRKYGGTGLGLFISRQLVEMMGGHIWMESEPGKGSNFQFTVSLPIVEEAVMDQKTFVAALKPLNILLVEDDEMNRVVGRMMLEQDGHHVTTANDGLEGLESVALNNFDVVLMDVQMPNMDGYEATGIIRSFEQGGEQGGVIIEDISDELAKNLRTRLKGGHLPVIAMTANAMKSDREKCMELGMDDYLTKPFQPDQVTHVLREVVSGKI